MSHVEPTVVVSSGAQIQFIPKSPAEAAKAIGYVALTALGAIASASAGGFTSAEIITLALGVLGLIPVYLFAGPWVKAGSAVAVAGLQAIALLVANGTGFTDLTTSDWTGVIVTVLAAGTVLVVPNKESSRDIATRVAQAVQLGDGDGVTLSSKM